MGACSAKPAHREVVIAYPSTLATTIPDTVNEEFTSSIHNNIFEALVDFDAKLAVSPGLAESWYTEDDHTWVFRLRSGVLFHDGRPLEAADVVASLDRARHDPTSKRRAELVSIDTVTAKDPLTLVIRTKEAFGALPHRLASVVIWRAGAGNAAPVGTGPYRLTSFTPGGDVVLSAFEQYRGGVPRIRTLRFVAVPSAAERLARLRRGEVHLTLDVPPEEMQALAATPGLRAITEHGLRVIYLALGCKPDSPFHDVRVRRAAALAIDRASLVRGPLRGQADLADQLVAPPVFGYVDGFPGHPYDPAEARRLMAEAGRAAGFDVELDYMPAKYRAMDQVTAAVIDDLRKIGIRVTARQWSPAELFKRIESTGSPFYLLGWMSTGGDAAVSFDYLLHTRGGPYGVDNGGNYSSPQIDGWLQEQEGQLNTDARLGLLADIAKVIQHDVPVIPLYRQADIYGLAADLQFQPRVDRRVRAFQMAWKQ